MSETDHGSGSLEPATLKESRLLHAGYSQEEPRHGYPRNILILETITESHIFTPSYGHKLHYFSFNIYVDSAFVSNYRAGIANPYQ